VSTSPLLIAPTLLSRVLLPNFHVMVLMLRMVLLSAILENARALLISSALAPHFWAEAVSTVVFLINRQPSTSLQGCTPYERLFGTPPSYSHLRCFGCVYYVLLPPRERTKLTASLLTVFSLGTVLNTRAIAAMTLLLGG
jgi:hypothetical protein